MRGHLLLCPPPSGHPHTPPPWPASVYTCCLSLAWQEAGWVRIQKAGALQLLQGNYHKLTLHLAKGSWMSQRSARAPNRKKHWDKGKPEAKARQSSQTEWGQEEGFPFQLAILLGWGYPGDLHNPCLVAFA